MKMFIINILSFVTFTFVSSSPTSKFKTNIFEDFKKTTVNCPALAKSYLSDPSSLYLEECASFPSELNLTDLNTDKFLCVGVLDAEYKLCEVLNNKTYSLPNDHQSLSKQIVEISNKEPKDVCKSLLGINETSVNVTSLYVRELNTYLKNFSMCTEFCKGIQTKTKTFCSLITYIYEIIADIKQTDTHKDVAETTIVETGVVKPEDAQTIDNKIIDNNVSKTAANIVVAPVQSKKTEVPLPVQNSNTLKDTSKLQSELSNVIKEAPVMTPSKKQGTFIPTLPSTINTGKSSNKTQAQSDAFSQIGKKDVTIPDEKTANVKISDDKVATDKLDDVKLADIKNDNDKNADDKIADDKIADDKIADDKIVDDKIADDKIADDKITDEKIVEDKIDSEKIEDVNVEDLIKNNDNKPLTDEKKNEKDYDKDPTETEADFQDNLEQTDYYTKNEAPNTAQKDTPEKFLITPGKSYTSQFDEVEDSNFFAYFMFISVLFIGGYIAYHNKQKILALVLEGRRDRNSRRRPNTASYRKLNSNLEEAVTSKSGGSASNVIY